MVSDHILMWSSAQWVKGGLKGTDLQLQVLNFTGALTVLDYSKMEESFFFAF